MILVTDQEDFGIGTISMSTPPNEIISQSVSSPLNMFGVKDTMLTTIIGKMASKKLNKPVLSMILLKESGLKQKTLIEITSKSVIKAIESIES